MQSTRNLSACVCARTSAQDKPGFDVEVITIPPFPYLDLVGQALEGSVAQLGAQVCVCVTWGCIPHLREWGRA
jgi:triosephosphate isomerase